MYEIDSPNNKSLPLLISNCLSLLKRTRIKLPDSLMTTKIQKINIKTNSLVKMYI